MEPERKMEGKKLNEWQEKEGGGEKRLKKSFKMVAVSLETNDRTICQTLGT